MQTGTDSPLFPSWKKFRTIPTHSSPLREILAGIRLLAGMQNIVQDQEQ